MLGKPKSIEALRDLLLEMRGSDQIYSYTGNAILLADKDKNLQMINVTDVVRLSFDNISDESLEEYLKEGNCLNYCGGLSVTDGGFVHVLEGNKSTS